MAQPALSAHILLRSGTSDKHAEVDAAFTEFALVDRASYVRFLQIHARILQPVEHLLSSAPNLPEWRPRMALLADDLRELNTQLPPALPVSAAFSDAELHGLLYVVEGSRLGGGILARQVGEGLPKAYLSATHTKGEWKLFLGALDDRAAMHNPGWLDDVVTGARRGFDLFAAAAKTGDAIAA